MAKRKNYIIKTEQDINDEMILDIIGMIDNFDSDTAILEHEALTLANEYADCLTHKTNEEVDLMASILSIDLDAMVEIDLPEEQEETSDVSEVIDFLHSIELDTDY